MKTYARHGGLGYPVRHYERWIGDGFEVMAGDVLSPAFQAFVAGHNIGLVYCDPPWNEGIVTGFYAKAGLQKPPEASFAAVHEVMVSVAAERAIPAFVECSVAKSDEVADVIEAAGGTVVARWRCTYSGSLPNDLLLADWSGRLPAGPGPVFDGCRGWEYPRAAIEWARRAGALAEGAAVLDPFMGTGQTLRAGLDLGVPVVGFELSTFRLSAALTVAAGYGARPVVG